MITIPESSKPKAVAVVLAVVMAGLLLSRTLVFDPVDKKRRVLSAQAATETRRQELLYQIIGVEKNLAAYKGAVPQRREISWLIEEMNRIAADSSITLITVAPMGDEKIGEHWRSSLRLEARVGYHDFGAWVARIESSEPFIKINSARLETIPEQQRQADGGGPLKATLFVSFFYPQREAAA
ncbi:MAG: hypothetical protein MOGMAGMI_00980 [Candidatus Omnitrophica bacterium]|nr:hypothetical protein [Candidatus Omnitrophota bacterium]